MFRFLFLTLFPVVSATISDKCLQELGALYESGNLEDGLSVSVSDFAQELNADGACTPNNGSTYSCVYDYSTVANAVEPLCKELGGKLDKWSFNMGCELDEGSGTMIQGLDMSFTNLPVCFGKSCTDAEVQEFIEQDRVFGTADQAYTGAGYICETSFDYSGGSGGGASDGGDSGGEGSGGEGSGGGDSDGGDSGGEDSAAPSLGQCSLLISVAMSGLWWIYNV